MCRLSSAHERGQSNERLPPTLADAFRQTVEGGEALHERSPRERRREGPLELFDVRSLQNCDPIDHKSIIGNLGGLHQVW